MKLNKQKIIKTTLILIFVFYQKAYSYNLSIGSGYIYGKINDPKLRYINEYESNLPMINIGLSHNYKKLFYGLNTNRLFNKANIRGVVDTSGNNYDFKSKVLLDSFVVGYASKIAPFVFIGNVINEKELISNGSAIKKDREAAIIYGVGISKKINNHSFNINAIAPCQALKLEYAIGFGYSYNFKIK